MGQNKGRLTLVRVRRFLQRKFHLFKPRARWFARPTPPLAEHAGFARITCVPLWFADLSPHKLAWLAPVLQGVRACGNLKSIKGAYLPYSNPHIVWCSSSLDAAVCLTSFRWNYKSYPTSNCSDNPPGAQLTVSILILVRYLVDMCSDGSGVSCGLAPVDTDPNVKGEYEKQSFLLSREQ